MPSVGKMQKYSHDGHETGVVSYSFGKNSINVLFKEGWYYLYDDQKPGADHVKNMKALAVKGIGLSTYISQHIRDNYHSKWKKD